MATTQRARGRKQSADWEPIAESVHVEYWVYGSPKVASFYTDRAAKDFKKAILEIYPRARIEITHGKAPAQARAADRRPTDRGGR